MKYRHVYFLGVDMGTVNGALWHYGANPDISAQERLQRFDLEAKFFEHAARVLRPEERKRIMFASSYNRYGFVDAFNRRGHLDIVPEILRAAQSP